MVILILSLWGVGLLLSFVGGIWLLILAFRQSVRWGLAVFFIPFASLFFIVKYWAEARHPFFVHLASLVLFGIGFALGAMTSPPLGEMGVSGTEVADFEPSSDPFGSGDPFGSRQPSQAEDPSTARPSAGTDAEETGGRGADRADQDIDSLLAEIEGRDVGGGDSAGGGGSAGGGDSAAESAGTERPEEPGADTGGPAPVATSTTTVTRHDRREVESRAVRRGSSVPRAAGFPRGSDRSIPRDQLSRHVGQRLEVDMADGDRLQGVLKAVEGDQIRLVVSLSGGSMTLRLPFERIKEIHRPR